MKVGICITLLLGGLVLAMNEGPTFPWVNVVGLGLLAACAFLSNLWSEKIR